MFYEEKVIDGILHARTSPNGKWEEFTSEELTRRYTKMKEDLQRLQTDGTSGDTIAEPINNDFVDCTIQIGKLNTHIAKLQLENECMVKKLANNCTAAIALYESVVKDVIAEGVH